MRGASMRFAAAVILLLALTSQAQMVDMVVVDYEGHGAKYLFANHTGVYMVGSNGRSNLAFKTTSISSIAVAPSLYSDLPTIVFSNSTGIYRAGMYRKALPVDGPCNNCPWEWKIGDPGLIKKTTSVSAVTVGQKGYNHESNIYFTNSTGMYSLSGVWDYAKHLIVYGEPKLFCAG